MTSCHLTNHALGGKQGNALLIKPAREVNEANKITCDQLGKGDSKCQRYPNFQLNRMLTTLTKPVSSADGDQLLPEHFVLEMCMCDQGKH